jgi:hypothetical protein
MLQLSAYFDKPAVKAGFVPLNGDFPGSVNSSGEEHFEPSTT